MFEKVTFKDTTNKIFTCFNGVQGYFLIAPYSFLFLSVYKCMNKDMEIEFDEVIESIKSDYDTFKEFDVDLLNDDAVGIFIDENSIKECGTVLVTSLAESWDSNENSIKLKTMNSIYEFIKLNDTIH